uniref:Uncharacterized protein n=1 Tax=Chaetoceros debilis TaxID=122233 RepID=A0A7S3V5U1_9STRA
MATDPSSLLLKQVKIHSVSAKPELNGKVGVAQSYIPDRNRYLVTLPTPSQTVALRPENLSPATMVDKARAKVEDTVTMAQTIYKDERFREELRRAYRTVDQRLPANVNPKQVGFVLSALFLGLVYMLGITRTFMLLSLIMMGGVVAMPDVIARRDAKTIAKNFPNRWREAIEQNTGYKPTPNIANAILVAMLLVSGKVLLTSTATGRAPSSPPMNYDGVGTAGAGSASSIIPFTMEEVYKMGYDDAQGEKTFGESLPENHATMAFSSPSTTSSSSQFDYSDYDSYAPPPPPAPKSKFGFGTIMALFALGRTVKELGFVNGKFEKDLFLVNVKNLPPLKMGFLALMGYRLLSAFT